MEEGSGGGVQLYVPRAQEGVIITDAYLPLCELNDSQAMRWTREGGDVACAASSADVR